MTSKDSRKKISFRGISVWLVLVGLLAVSVLFLSVQIQATVSQKDNELIPSQTIPAEITDGQWNLILVNREYSLPKEYQTNLIQLSNGEKIDERVYPFLQKMFDDARSQGVFPVVSSGYRTQEVQQILYDREIEKYREQGYGEAEAEKLASEWVAVPGTSEHQLGIAADINADTGRCTSEKVYQWMAENSWKYGFILRYPENKIEITKIQYEPWHFRYVGKEAAEEIYDKRLCLEEYLVQKGLV